MKTLKSNLLLIIAVLAAALGIIFMTLPFYTASLSSSFLGVEKTSSSITGIQFAFGDSEKNIKQAIGILFVFILGIAGAVIALIGCFIPSKKDNKLVGVLVALIACLALVAAGVLCFFTLKLTNGETGSLDLGDLAKADIGIGVGAIISGVCFCLAGFVSLVQIFKRLVK